MNVLFGHHKQQDRKAAKLAHKVRVQEQRHGLPLEGKIKPSVFVDVESDAEILVRALVLRQLMGV